MNEREASPVSKRLLAVLGCCAAVAGLLAIRMINAEPRPSETGFGPPQLARVDSDGEVTEPWRSPPVTRDPFRPYQGSPASD